MELNMDSHTDIISIIVPVYNTEQYLSSCLDSILNQTYKNIELIIINDGSTDRSAEICDLYSSKDTRIKVIHKMNGGVSTARNLSLSIASGNYIGFIDSDDIISSHMFELLYNNIKDNDCEVSVCGIKVCSLNNIGTKNSINRKVIVEDNRTALCNLLVGKYYAGHSCNKLFKKSAIQNTIFNEDIYVYEDLLFVTKVFLNCTKIVYDSEPNYYYFIRNTSAYNRAFTEKQYTALNACYEIKNMLQDPLYTHYTEANILLCNLYLLERLIGSKTHILRYTKEIKNNLRKHYNKSSIKLLKKRKANYLRIATINPYLYYLMRIIIRQIKKLKEERVER